jgi:elongation factor Tu
VLLDRGAAPLRPGDTAIVDVELSVIAALQIGQRFVIREGGRTVGTGFVVKFLD